MLLAHQTSVRLWVPAAVQKCPNKLSNEEIAKGKETQNFVLRAMQGPHPLQNLPNANESSQLVLKRDLDDDFFTKG